MNNRHNDWTEQMRQRLDGARVDVPDDLWAAIETRLDEQGIGSTDTVEKPRRRVVAMWRWAAAASVVVAVGMGLWWQTRDGGAGSGGVDTKGIVATGGGKATSAAAATDMVRQADGGAAVLAARRTVKRDDAPRGAAEAGGEGQEAVAATCADGSSQPPAYHDDTEHEAAAGPSVKQPASKVAPRPTAMLRSESTAAAGRTSQGGHRWQVGMSTAGSMGRYNATGGVVAARPVPGYMSAQAANNVLFSAEPMLNDIKESTHHDMPVAVGLTASYRLTDRLALTSGLVYTLATSTFEHGTSGSMSRDEQTLHYIGIPLSASYEVWGNRRVQTYVTAGGQADFNVSARVTTDGHTADTDRDRAQLSVGGGIGVQLNVVKQLGVYVEPGVKYYFDNGSRVQNVFKAHPCNFSLQVGVRYNIQR